MSNYPNIQILTVCELLEGRGIDMPSRRAIGTFKKVPIALEEHCRTQQLPLRLGFLQGETES